MANKKFQLGLLVLVFVLLFDSCGTLFHTRKAKVKASSGSNATVQVLENGVQIYNGPLPAQIPVKNKRSYSIQYTTENGEARAISIGQSFNGWFIGSIILGFLPAIVDLVTGNVTQVRKTTNLPISYSDDYSPMIILLGENIPYHQDLEVIGNFNF